MIHLKRIIFPLLCFSPLLFFIHSSCVKKQSIEPGSNNDTTITGITVNEWKFTADGKQYKGVIYVAYLVQGSGLSVEASTLSSNDTSLLFHIGFPGNEISNGYYNTADLPYNSLFYMSDISTMGIFDANPNTANYGAVTFQIVSYDAIAKQIKVKFSGKALYKYQSTLTITDGALWATLN